MGGAARRAPIFITTLALLFTLGASPASAAGSTLQTLINQDRAANGGLAALAWSDCLASVALANDSPQRGQNSHFALARVPQPGQSLPSTPTTCTPASRTGRHW